VIRLRAMALGGRAMMDRHSSVIIVPFPSMGYPTPSITRPNISGPQRMRIGAPVEITSAPG